MKSKAFVILILFFISAINAVAQESVVLRSDRDLYIAGESMWLTVDCLKNDSSDPSDLSKVVYVELLNGNNEPVSQAKLFLENGSASTRVTLPDILTTGNYQMRAYTKWMKNYDAGLYFTKSIAVINPFSQDPFPQAEYIYQSDTVVFYPEGNNVVTGQTNRFLMRSFDRSGQAKAVSGNVVSPSGDIIKEIECGAAGVLAFSLPVPESGSYSFVFSDDESGKQAAFKALENGNKLTLEKENADNLVFGIYTTSLETQNRNLDIITASGTLLKSYSVPDNKEAKVSVNTTALPATYLTALLTRANGEVVASRYFVAPVKLDDQEFQINTGEEEYSQRSPVTIQIEKPEDLSHVSVSVVKECLQNYQSRIAYVASPLEIPMEYFMSESQSSIEINDLLMAYQPVTSIRGENEALFLPEIKNEIISGTILDIETREPIRNEAFMLSFVGKHPTLDIYRTDEQGRFYFESDRVGEQEIVIQPYDNQSLIGNYKVNIDLPFCTEYPKQTATQLFVDKENMAEINAAIVNMQVKLLYEPFNPAPAIPVETQNPPPFYGIPSSSTKLDNFIELPTMQEVIREIVPQASLVKKDDEFSISIAEGDLAYSRELNSFCLVDGVPISNQNNILNMNAQRVERIDVENRDVFVKSYKIGKVFSLITKNGDMGAFEFDKRIFRQSFQAYQAKYDFNSPDYSFADAKVSRLPDFRNVLYWNPQVEFDSQNKSELHFYTADENSVYKVVVEGIDESGITRRKEIRLEVKENL